MAQVAGAVEELGPQHATDDRWMGDDPYTGALSSV
jgi:hypothetical protein